MANITVDQAKLVLNAFAAIFQNNLLSSDIVTWKQYDTEMNDRDKLTVVEQVGPRYVVTQTTNGVQDLTAGVQDTVFGSEQFQINKTFGSSMGWGDFVKIRDIGEARESEALKNAATQLAEQIDHYVISFLGNASNNWLGTPGVNVATYNDVASGYTRLKELGVEDNDLRAVLTYNDRQSLGNAIVFPTGGGNLNDMGSEIYRSGFTGEVDGIPTMFTQQLGNQSFGTRTNGTVAGAGQNVHYSAVSISPAPGQYMTQTLNIAGLGAGATIQDGEVFTLTNGTAPIFAYDNRAQQANGYAQQFRVIGNTTADGTGAATVRIFPAIIIPSAGTAGDAAVDTANATCSVAPASGAIVTWLGTAAATARPRFITQKQAVIVNTADLIMPATGIGSRKTLTKVPLSVRMWQNSDFNTGNHMVRFDVALTANVRDRRRVVRINGVSG